MRQLKRKLKSVIIWLFRLNVKVQPNAMLIVEKSRKRCLRYIKPKKIPFASFDRDYYGQWLHVLGVTLKGQLWPIGTPDRIEGRMPTDLYMAVNCADEVEETYGLSMPLSEKIKWGIFIGLICGNFILIFLLAASAGG